MRKLLFFIVCLVSFLCVRECFAEKSSLILVPEDAGRVSQLGLSILPPKGSDWYVLVNNPNGGLMFSKSLDGGNHTLVCSFTVVPLKKKFTNLDNYLDYVKRQQENMSRRRFKDIKTKYELNKRFGDYSVEYTMSAKDTKRKTSDGEYLFLKTHGYAFVHPKDSDYAVDIVYSERGVSEFFTPSFENIGNEFIDNLIIEK